MGGLPCSSTYRRIPPRVARRGFGPWVAATSAHLFCSVRCQLGNHRWSSMKEVKEQRRNDNKSQQFRDCGCGDTTY